MNLLERRRSLLVERIDDLRAAFRAAHRARPFDLIAIVVLPEHLHCLWRLPEGDTDNVNRWAQIKTGFSRRIPAIERRSAVRIARRERGIWQRRYWERLIEHDDDLRHHVDYIHYNPVKHAYARHVCDWPYSSFHRGVRDGQYPMGWSGPMTP